MPIYFPSEKLKLYRVLLHYLGTPWQYFVPLSKRVTMTVWLPKGKHRFCHRHFNFSINLDLTFYYHLLLKRLEIEVNWKTFQKKNWLKTSSLSMTLHQKSDLTNRFDDFLRRFEVVSSDLAITRNCNRLLTERVVQSERNAVTNAQYHRRESVEVNPIPPSISDEELELNICKYFL